MVALVFSIQMLLFFWSFKFQSPKLCPTAYPTYSSACIPLPSSRGPLTPIRKGLEHVYPHRPLSAPSRLKLHTHQVPVSLGIAVSEALPPPAHVGIGRVECACEVESIGRRRDIVASRVKCKWWSRKS